MKEAFDLSYYLNTPEKPKVTQKLSEAVTKAISANQETERVDLSEPSERSNPSTLSEPALSSESLNEVKETENTEHSEREKQQAVSSIPRRISHKQRQESLESYRKTFLTPHKIIDRKTSYPSRSTWERLEFVVHRLGDYGANVSSFLESA